MIVQINDIIYTMFGYIDESGAPGVASNSNDFLVVSVMLFDSEDAAKKCSESIDRLRKRLKLREGYEFHRSHNSNKTQAAVIQLLSGLDFKFITIAIKKNHARTHATYLKLARLLLHEISTRFKEVKIEMDANPPFCAELRRQARAAKLYKFKFRELKSHKHNLIQATDYIVSLSSHKARNTVKSAENYRAIAKKQLVFLEIRAG